MSELGGLVYVPPNNQSCEARPATLGVKFSNDVFLLESFLKQRNINYEQSDLEQTLFGMAHRIKREKKEMLTQFPEGKTMDIIKSKKTLNALIRDAINEANEAAMVFPKTFKYSEGIGEPIFTITLDKRKEDFFIDEKGQKWIKAD